MNAQSVNYISVNLEHYMHNNLNERVNHIISDQANHRYKTSSV